MSAQINAIGAGFSFATQLAMLEMESEQTQYRADCAIRDAARQSKREANQKEIEQIRSKASSIMTQAITTGALQVAAGGAQIASVSFELDAGYAKLESADLEHSIDKLPADSPMHEAMWKKQTALDAEALARATTSKFLCASSDILTKSNRVVELASSTVTNGHDAAIAQEKHRAEDAHTRAHDANEAARRRLSQLDQKLGILQQILDSEAETRRAMLRG